MTAVSRAVQAHPHRWQQATALAERLDAEVVYDPEPDDPIRSPWRTFRHLLELTPAWATHRLQIQDDAITVENMAGAVEKAVSARPDDLLVWFVSSNPAQHQKALMDACGRGESWAWLPPAYWTPVVATTWPVAMIADLLTYVDAQNWRPSFCSDDEIVGRFVRENGIRPLASVPSLVEHPDEQPSLVKRHWRGTLGRRAACFPDETFDALAHDWTLGP